MSQSPVKDVLNPIRDYSEKENLDYEHVTQVTRCALILFDLFQNRLKLHTDDRVLLEAAALMHDIGQKESFSGHHKIAQRFILDSALFKEFPKQDKQIVACVARYHRKGMPKSEHPVYCDLDESGQSIVRRLAALLRVADGLDRTHDSSVQDIQFSEEDNTIQLFIYFSNKNSTNIYGALRKSDLLEAELGKPIQFFEK